MNTFDKPWWFPELCDEQWIARIRSDYPEDTAGMDDASIHEEYGHGYKYSVLWDHIGDAYEEYEALADAYLKLLNDRGTDKPHRGKAEDQTP